MDKIEFVYTYNYRKGRIGGKITHVVIHGMSGTYAGSKAWFANPRSQVSAHYLVSKKGDACQMVKEADTAWHVCNANPFTIGIELEDASFVQDPKTGRRKTLTCLDDPNWFTVRQLDVASDIVADVCHRYSIPVTNIIGHNDKFLKAFGNNHADPGPYFPMDKFRTMVQQKIDTLNGKVGGQTNG